MRQKIKTIVFILFFALLWVPMVQQKLNYFKELELKGAYVKPELPNFTVDSLKSLEFQKQFEDYQNFNFGFRPFFVKLRNTINYLVYDELSVYDNIVGNYKFVFSLGSTRRTLGLDYNGIEKNSGTIDKIETLKLGIEKHGGHLLVLIAPSKESVIPDYLPRPYNVAFNPQTDYKDIIEDLKKRHIEFIDYCALFNLLKKSGKPLFTKTGFHWSMYGASIAQDTLVSYIRRTTDQPIPQYENTGIEFSDAARGSDADFEEPLNLLLNIGQSQYIYSKQKMIESTKNNFRPKAIIIGDSYFWQIKGQKMIQEVLSKDSKYLYYFSTSFPIGDEPGNSIDSINVIKELESANYVILISNISNLGTFPFGVTDYYYNNGSMGLEVEIANGIKNTPSCMARITKEAKLKDIDVELVINNDATRIVKEKIIFNLKSDAKYMCADKNLNNAIVINRDNAGLWETFSLLKLDEDHVVISSSENKFLSVELNNEAEVTATRTKIGGWEIFELEHIKDGYIALKAVNGKYLNLDKKSSRIFANSTVVKTSGIFKIMPSKGK